MKNRRKWIIWVVAAVLVLSAVGWMVSRHRKANGKDEVVRIEEVKRGDLTERVSAPGEIEPKTTVQISAKVSARIVEMPYDEGAVVTCGDSNANPPTPASMLLKLDAKDLESQLRLAEAGRNAQEAQIEVEKARVEGSKANLVGLAASLEQGEKDLERKKGLIESRDISKADFDQVKYKVDTLRAEYEGAKYNLDATERNLVVMRHNLEAAEARIAEANQMLSYTTILSPINGVVTRVNAKVGEMVMTGTMNNPGTVILEVSDLSQMLLVAQVDEADIGGLEVGQEAAVVVQAFPDIKFKGVVDKIALKHRFSSSQTRYYRTEILLQNDPNVSKLCTGLTADVDIETRKHTDVIKVPSQAVVAREVDGLPMDIRDKSSELDKDKKFAPVVFRENGGKAVVTPVKIGQADLTHTIIVSGLKEGDKIVVGPYKILDKLTHEQKLKDEREVEKEKKAKEKKAEDKKDSNDSNEPAGK
ncbi:MAG: efflux RND transporter periplasmic adaptor subunit [Sedimentisphaerales bacterium]|nr:efflux RND transporter periplasmic adaptor subunit [Sedimentisphaerales bacterium]